MALKIKEFSLKNNFIPISLIFFGILIIFISNMYNLNRSFLGLPPIIGTIIFLIIRNTLEKENKIFFLCYSMAKLLINSK